MAINLSELNEKMEKKAENAKMARYKDPFQMYEDRLAKKEKFEVKFNSADRDGNLYFRDENGTDLCLPIEALQLSDRYYNVILRGNYVGIKTLEVMVDHVDRDNRMVFLKSGRVNESTAKQIRGQLDAYNRAWWEWRETGRQLKKEGKDIDDAEVLKNLNADRVKSGKNPLVRPEENLEVYGTIKAVNGERTQAYVDLFDQKIQAVILRDNWTEDFLPYFPEDFVSTHPDPVKFDLIGTFTDPFTKHKFYNLSTRRFDDDAWDNAPKALLERKGVVEAMATVTDDRCWWGKIEGFPRELWGKYNPNIPIKIGYHYLCTVKRTDIKGHHVTLVPFKYVQYPGETLIKTITNKGNAISKEKLENALNAINEEEAKEDKQE